MFVAHTYIEEDRLTPKYRFASLSTSTSIEVQYDRPPNCSYDIYCEFCNGPTTTIEETDMTRWNSDNTDKLFDSGYHYLCKYGVSARHRFLLKLAKEDILNLNAIDVYMPDDHEQIMVLAEKFIALEKHVNLVTSHYAGLDLLTEHAIKGKFLNYIEDTPQDLTALTYGDESFDYVHCNHTLEHIYDYKQSIAELHRVLRKGGTLIITVPMHYQQENNLEWARLDSDGNIIWNYQPAYHGRGTEFPVFWEFGIQLFYDIKEIFSASEVTLETYVDYSIGVFNQGFNIIRVKK